MVLFFLSAGGIRSETCNKVAGWWGMWVALICFYAATAILTVDVWGHVSALLSLSHFTLCGKEAHNAPLSWHLVRAALFPSHCTFCGK